MGAWTHFRGSGSNILSEDVRNHFGVKFALPWDFFFNSLSGFAFNLQFPYLFNYRGRNAVILVYVLSVAPDISFYQLDTLHFKEHFYGFWDRAPVWFRKLYYLNLWAVLNKGKNVLVWRPESQVNYSFVWIQCKDFFSRTHNPYFQSLSSRSIEFFSFDSKKFFIKYFSITTWFICR